MEGRWKSQVTPWTVWVVCINVLAFSLLAAFLFLIRGMLALVVISAFLAMAVSPAVRLVERLRVRRWVAVCVVSAGVVILLAAAVAVFAPMFVEQGGRLTEEAPRLIERLRVQPWAQWAEQRFHISDRVKSLDTGNADVIVIWAKGIIIGVAATVFNLVTIAVLTVFMLIFGPGVLEGALQFLPQEKRAPYRRIGGRVEQVVGGYVLGTFMVSSLGGALITLSLAILGVPYFLPLGLAMLILGMLPYVGPTLAAILIIGVTLASSSLSNAIIIAVIFVGYQTAENNLLQPLVQNRTIKLDPLLIIFAMLAGTSLAGILGALLALPVAGAIQVVLQEVVPKKPLPHKER